MSLSPLLSRKQRRPQMPALEQPSRLSAPFLVQLQAPQSPMRWSGASKTARRKSRTSARSWMRKTSSRVLPVISLRPHPNPSNPCKTHNLRSRPQPQFRSQYTATLMLNHAIRLHRRSRIVFTLRRNRLMLNLTILLHRRSLVVYILRPDRSRHPQHTTRRRSSPRPQHP